MEILECGKKFAFGFSLSGLDMQFDLEKVMIVFNRT